MSSHDLIPLIYAAVEDSTLWTPFLDAFRHEMRTSHAVFWLTRTEAPRIAFSVNVGIPESVERQMHAEGYCDPWMSRVNLDTVTIGQILRSNEICPDEILVQDEWFRRLCAPNGWHYGGGVLLQAGKLGSTGMGTSRSRELGPLTDAELALWQSLVPHLTRAVRLIGKQNKIAYERDAVVHCLNPDQGIILALPTGIVVTANQRAEAALNSESAGLQVVAGRLHAVHPEQHQTLAAALTQTGSAKAPDPVHLSLHDTSGNPDLLVMVLPVKPPPPSPSAADMPTALLYLTDVSNSGSHQADITFDPTPLRQLYDFTEAEARLACLLAQGLDITQSATRLHVSANTIRTHLQRALAKSNRNRQTELVILVHRFCRRLTNPANAEPAG